MSQESQESQDGPPHDDDLNQSSDDEDSRGGRTELRRRYPETPLHDRTVPNSLPITEICMSSICLAVIIAHLWTVWAMRADVNVLMVNQKETRQQIGHIAKLVETMHTVRWHLVSEV
tara:strand:+ start:153 stop:503 length:351 start_codon:yes stop_codon:yes gene_type:complete